MILFLPVLAGLLGRSALGAMIARGGLGELVGSGALGSGKGLVPQITNLFQGITQKGGIVNNVLNAFNGKAGGSQSQSAPQRGVGTFINNILNAFGGRNNPQQQPQPRQPGIGGILNRLANLIVGHGPTTRTPDAATMPGLSLSQMVSMMGKSQQDIQQAHEDAQREQAEAAAVTVPGNAGLLGGFAGFAKALVPLEGAALGAVKGLDVFGETVLESQKGLRMFDGQIDRAISRLELQQFRLAGQTAGNTAQTTEGLANQLEAFNEEFQPVKEDLVNLFNQVATIGVYVGRGILAIEKWMPLLGSLGLIERHLRKKDPGSAAAFRRMLKQLSDLQNPTGAATPLAPLP